MLPNSLSGQDVKHLYRPGQVEELEAVEGDPVRAVHRGSRQELDRVQEDFPETPIIRKPFKSKQLVEAIQWIVARPDIPTPTSLDAQ